MALIQATGAAVGGLAGGAAGAAAGLNETANNFAVLIRFSQIAAQTAQYGLDKLSSAEAAMLQSCVNNAACRQLVSGVLPAAALTWLINQNTVTPQSSLADQIPRGYGAEEPPRPAGPLINVPVERDPKEGVLVNVPVPVDTSVPGYSPEKPPAAEGPLVTPNNGPVGGTVVMSEQYVPSPKHNPVSGWGTPMDLNDSRAQEVLDDSTQFGRQRYGFSDGKIYEFQPDNAGGWHGYPIPGNEAPPSFLRGLRDQGEITNAEYNQLVRGK